MYEYVSTETQSDIMQLWTECPLPLEGGEVHQVTPVPDCSEPKSTGRSGNPKVKRPGDDAEISRIAGADVVEKKKARIKEALDKSVLAGG